MTTSNPRIRESVGRFSTEALAAQDDEEEVTDVFMWEWRACVAMLSLIQIVQCFCLRDYLP